MSFSNLGLSDKVLAAVCRHRLHQPHSHPGTGDPACSRAARRAGHRPDRHRQDRRLRPADADHAGKGPRPRADAAHADPGADPRTRRAGSRRTSSATASSQKLNVALLIGGVSFGDQDAKLDPRRRCADRHARAACSTISSAARLLLTGVELLVIDEADRMLDMGFIPDIERICKLVPFTRQTLFFTATMPPEIPRITEQLPAQSGYGRGLQARATAATADHRHAVGSPRTRRSRMRSATRCAGLIQGRAKDLQERDHLLQPQARCRAARTSLAAEVTVFGAVALHGDMDAARAHGRT